MAALFNVLLGLAQPLVPSIVTGAITAGWVDPTSLSGWLSIILAVATAASSAVTTTAVKK